MTILFRVFSRDFLWCWVFLLCVGLFYRPLTPVDETRAVSVAWEMWQRGDFLIPHLNGEPYSHKPPLLQWGIHLVWLLFGVHEYAARVVAPLFGLVNLFLVSALARKLWPHQCVIHTLSPLILLSFPIWAVWTTLTLYDMLTTTFTLLGLLGFQYTMEGKRWLGPCITGLAIGSGILSKGPVILLFVLPVGILAPMWQKETTHTGWTDWYRGIFFSLLLGVILALVWAIPAGLSGGAPYQKAIFWGQSVGRMAHSFAHQRPFWWYAIAFPILLFPWVGCTSLWRNTSSIWKEPETKFCLIHISSVLLSLSLVSAKQIHYLLPIMPTVALFLTRLLSEVEKPSFLQNRRWIGGTLVLLGIGLIVSPFIGLPTNSDIAEIAEKAPRFSAYVILIIGLSLFFSIERFTISDLSRHTAYVLILFVAIAHPIYWGSQYASYNMRPVGEYIGTLQAKGVPIAHWGKYNGEYQFAGRLIHPLVTLMDRSALDRWIHAHPDGYLVAVSPVYPVKEIRAAHIQLYRGHRHQVAVWSVATLLSNPTLLPVLTEKHRKVVSAGDG